MSRAAELDNEGLGKERGGDGGSAAPCIDDGEQGCALSRARRVALVATLTGAAFLNTLSIQSLVILLPAIGRDLSVPESRRQWIVSSYSLAFGCCLLFWGRIADVCGKRYVFILGSAWVTAVTAANAFVPGEIAFNVFRGLQGLGAAANIPTAIGIIGVTFPPGKTKNYAFSTYAAGAPLGSVFGNFLSGLIAQYASWRWVLGVIAILSIVITIAGYVIIPRSSNARSDGALTRGPAALPPPPPSIDWLGAFLITTGLIGLTFALTEGDIVGWGTPWISATIVASLLVILSFVVWQIHLERRTGRRDSHHHRPPLITVSLFRNTRFSAVMLIMALFFASFNNFLVYATYFYQDYQGLSPLQTMLRFLPTGIGGILTALVVANLLDRLPTFFLLVGGNIAVSLASLLFALPLAPTTSYFAYALQAMLLSVIGTDITWPCLTLFTSQTLAHEHQAMGGALIMAVGQFGRAIGLAIATAIQTSVVTSARGIDIHRAGPPQPWDAATLRGLRATNWFNFSLGLSSLLAVVVFLRGMETVGRMRPINSTSHRPG